MRAIQFHLKAPRYLFSKFFGGLVTSLRFSRLGPVVYAEVSEPSLPNENWVKIRTVYGGICASDLSGILLKHPPQSYMSAFVSSPLGMGHEIVGVITEVGSGVTGLSVGDRVTVDPSLSCLTRGIEPMCPNCLKGDYSTCMNVAEGNLPPGTGIGSNNRTGGGWGEYVVGHKDRVHVLPESMSWETALFIEPLACAVHAVLKTPPQPGQFVLVFGAGTLGLCTVAALRALGFRGKILAAARYPFQAQAAKDFGADEVLPPCGPELFEAVARLTGGKLYSSIYGGNRMLLGGADVVFDWVGSTQTITDGLKLLRGQGTFVMGGIGYPKVVDWTSLWFQEITILGSSGHSTETWKGERLTTFALAIRLLADSGIELSKLLTHRFALKDYQTAFNTAVHKGRSGAIKVAFQFPH